MRVSISLRRIAAALGIGFLTVPCASAAEPAAFRWLDATAHAVPKDTTNEGEGYFSIITGLNGRVYVGTAKHGVGSFLVEFDPATDAMKTVVDTHKDIGTTATGFAAQSKIHTRNNVGPSGKIYFGTKQGYPGKDEKWEDYPGGYPMVYDPAIGKTQVYPIPVPHHGVISITPDEPRGIAYLSTCADQRPESSHFMILDLATGKYRDLIDCHFVCPFIVLDHRGRAYHPMPGVEIARYDPANDRLERLNQTIDGQSPAPESLLVFSPEDTQPVNWDVSPDGKTLYSVPMSGNRLYAYDLTADGETLAGHDLGALLPQAKQTDCRAMCVGPKGEVCVAITEAHADVGQLLHFVSYRPGDAAPRDLGPVRIANPDFTEFTDKEGKPLPFHHCVKKLTDGSMTTTCVILGVAQDAGENVYILSLCPYTVLEVKARARAAQ